MALPSFHHLSISELAAPSIDVLCLRAKTPVISLDYHQTMKRQIIADERKKGTKRARTDTDNANSATSSVDAAEESPDSGGAAKRRAVSDPPGMTTGLTRVDLSGQQYRTSGGSVPSGVSLQESFAYRFADGRNLLNTRLLLVSSSDPLWIVLFKGNNVQPGMKLWSYNPTNGIQRATSASAAYDYLKPVMENQCIGVDCGLYFDATDAVPLEDPDLKENPTSRGASDSSYLFDPWIQTRLQATWPAWWATHNGAAGSDGVDEDRSDIVRRCEPTSIEQEYNVHCQWLRLLRAPSKNGPDKQPVALDRDDLDSLRLASSVTISRLGNEWPSEEGDDTADTDFDDMLDHDAVVERVNEVRRLRHEELRQPAFPALGSTPYDGSVVTKKSTAVDQMVAAWKSICTNLLQGSLYSRSVQDLTIEHITPQAWMTMTASLCGFTYVAHDPMLCFIAARRDNEKRSHNALAFSSPDTSTYVYQPGPKWNLDRKAFAARVVAYAALTYPLLSQLGGAPVAATAVQDRPVSIGITSYATKPQWYALMRAIQREPAGWEIVHSMLAYGINQQLNPLAVSRDVRAEVCRHGSDLNCLLYQRLAGADLTSSAMLRSLLETATDE